MRKLLSLFLIMALAAGIFVLGGCSNQEEKTPATDQPQQQAEDLGQFKGQELNLFVAAGMKKPMDETITAFQEKSGSIVHVNYGPSGGLFAQIGQGQPCDLYYSADWIYIDKVEQVGKLEKSLKFLKDNLVLVVSSGGAAKVKSMQDLTKPEVSLVIADAQAPVGVYSENSLRELGLIDKLGDNIKARPSTVNQVAIMVKEDQVDAGLIYSSVANGNELDAVETIDEKYSGEIIFGSAIIKDGNTKLAEAFMNFASKNVAIFEKYGWKAYE